MELPASVEDVATPAFLVDLEVVKRNSQRMLDTCKRLGTELRAHMKTHKTVEGGVLATGGSKRKICVSTIKEAKFFADNGFDDILYAYPITADKIPWCTVLAERLEKFLVMLDGREGLEALEKAPRPGGKKWLALLEVDLGYGRTGVPWDSEMALTLARAMSESKVVQFEGLYAHCGASYSKHGAEELRKYGEETVSKMMALSDRLKSAGLEVRTVGSGSTPSMNRPVDRMSCLTELHPGNYVFNDYEQYTVGSCGLEDIAVCVATRVISHKPELQQLVLDCGFLALGHDGMQLPHPEGLSFCLIKGHPQLRMIDMSQELGKVRPVEGKLDFSKFPIGTMLYIVPWHSCLTAALHDKFYVHEGKKIVAVWKPVKGWY